MPFKKTKSVVFGANEEELYRWVSQHYPAPKFSRLIITLLKQHRAASASAPAGQPLTAAELRAIIRAELQSVTVASALPIPGGAEPDPELELNLTSLF